MIDNRTGIPQGFIEFGTVAHKVLMYVHEHPHSTLLDMVDILEIQLARLNYTTFRLAKYKFIFRTVKYRTGTRHWSWGWALYKKSHYTPPPVMTPLERTQRWRARKAVKVASVFNFRGSIEL